MLQCPTLIPSESMSTPPAGVFNHDVKVVSLVGVGHFCSHFYFLVLPPLFPVLKEVFGVSYTALGFALTVMAVTAAVVQAPMGFLVDRYGGRYLLITGLLLSGLGIVGIGLAPNFGVVLALMVLLGIGDSVVHPADYAILNKTVDSSRMGRAFSIHTFTGQLGFAAGPLTILWLKDAIGWQNALVVAGLGGITIALVMLLNRHLLLEPAEPEEEPAAVAAGTLGGVKLLLTLPILMGFVFYASVSLTSGGMSGFGISALHLQFDVSLAEAGIAVTTYLLVAPAGALIGGWLADRNSNHDLLVAVCFGVLALAALAVGIADLSWQSVIVLFAVTGFFVGAVNPARDMLIRSMVPRGQTGKVFGFVTIGLNVGGMIGPLLYGWLLDNSSPNTVFLAIAIFSLGTIAMVFLTARVNTRQLRAVGAVD